MATAQITEDLFKCSICQGPYVNPRILPECSDVFCENCLVTYITKFTSDQEEGLAFPCPNCRKQISRPKTKGDIQNLVKSMAGLDFRNEMVDTTLEIGNENHLCFLCKGRNKSVLAETYCINCSEYLCSVCSNIVHQMRNLTNHFVTKLNSDTETEKKTNIIKLFENYLKCSEHPYRMISHFCGQHGALCCVTCVLYKHKACQDVTELQNKDAVKVDESKKLRDQINMLQEQINVITEYKKNAMKNKKVTVENLRRQIEEMRTKLNSLFDSVEENVSAEATALIKEYALSTEEAIHELENLRMSLKLHSLLLEKVREEGANMHEFIVSHGLRTDIQCVRDKVYEMRFNEDFELKLKPSELLNEINKVNSTEAHTLASVEMLSTFTSPPNFPAEKETLVTKKITKKADNEILATDSPSNAPTYSDIHYLVNNQILLVDRYYKMCCLTDEKYLPKISLKLQEKPIRVTSLSNGKIVLTVKNAKKIVILSEQNLQVEQEIITKFIPKALAGMKNGRIAVAWCDPFAFGIITMHTGTTDDKEKTTVSDIVYFDHDKAMQSFKSFDYIAVNENRGIVVQPCTVDKAVYGFDFSGTPKFKYTHTELVSPRGVTCSGDGYIYVCEQKQSAIHMLTPNGITIQVIKEGLENPLALSLNSDGTELAVTRQTSPWARVTMFSIESKGK